MKAHRIRIESTKRNEKNAPKIWIFWNENIWIYSVNYFFFRWELQSSLAEKGIYLGTWNIHISMNCFEPWEISWSENFNSSSVTLWSIFYMGISCWYPSGTDICRWQILVSYSVKKCTECLRKFLIYLALYRRHLVCMFWFWWDECQFLYYFSVAKGQMLSPNSFPRKLPSLNLTVHGMVNSIRPVCSVLITDEVIKKFKIQTVIEKLL